MNELDEIIEKAKYLQDKSLNTSIELYGAYELIIRLANQIKLAMPTMSGVGKQ